ncbi:MAG TPA: winged helix-turn-helix domain-containing protein [Puia sp.]|nr:winged helix-turn-helix domain-containing protein [Puia sp.]
MVINNRFEVDPVRNEVTDRRTGKLNHVEPRLMKLLSLLADHKGKAVSRKMIVKEIWNDYPGGDEGLNQAISVLRKLLDDSGRMMIETIPKTGYCFHGSISPDQVTHKKKSFNAVYIPAALLLLLIIAVVLGYYGYRGPDKFPREQSVKSEDMRAAGEADRKGGATTDSAGRLDSKQSRKAEDLRAAGEADRKGK